MEGVSNREIADMLYQYAEILDVENANTFRIRAYRNAALTILNTHEPFTRKIERGDNLAKLPTIGRDIERVIRSIVSAGEFADLKALETTLSPICLALLKVEGVGPKRYRVIERHLGALSTIALLKAARGGELAKLPGVGQKTQDSILRHFSY